MHYVNFRAPLIRTIRIPMSNFNISGFGNLEKNVQEDWITVNVSTCVVTSYLTSSTNLSSKYLHVNYSENLKPAAGNQASLDSSVDVWNIIFVLFGCLLIIFFHFVCRVS